MKHPIGRRYTIAGRVQGVGYRYYVQKAARTLGLDGWVRNLSDGRVEAYAEGPASALEDFEGRLRHGPMLADVRSVEVMEQALSPKSSDKLEGFEIR